MRNVVTLAAVKMLSANPPVGNRTREWLQPRRTHLYNVGAPKTGTVSVADLFRSQYRSIHEGRYIESIEYLARRRAGTVSESELIRWLLRRDVMLWMECESSHVLCWFSDLLKDLFVDAKFVVTVRDCYSWTNSVIDQHLNSNPPEAFRRLRDVYYGERSADPDSILTRLGEFTLEGYVGYWARHYAYLLDHLPEQRTLFVWVRDLGARTHDMAEFAGVPASTLDAGQSHTHKAPEKHDVLGQLDPDVVRETILASCSAVAGRLGRLPGLEGQDLLGVPEG